MPETEQELLAQIAELRVKANDMAASLMAIQDMAEATWKDHRRAWALERIAATAQFAWSNAGFTRGKTIATAPKPPPEIKPDPTTMIFGDTWGGHFTVSRCDRCNKLVKDNWLIRHRKSGCIKGIFKENQNDA